MIQPPVIQLSINGVRVYAPDWIPRTGWSIHRKGYVVYTSRGLRHNIKRGEYMHRLVIERLRGWPLRDFEHVHHQDFDKRNNHPDNLVVMPHVLNPRSACRCPYTGRFLSVDAYRVRFGLTDSGLEVPDWVLEEG